MSNIQERPLTFHEQSEFKTYSILGAQLLNITVPEQDPAAVLQAMEKFIETWHKPRGSIFSRLFACQPDSVEEALGLGVVWGNQIVRKFGWEWTCVQDGGFKFYGVVSIDRALAIYPTNFVKKCLDDQRADCTALLAFNMLMAGSIPQLPPGGYQDVMTGVQRIVSK